MRTHFRRRLILCLSDRILYLSAWTLCLPVWIHFLGRSGFAGSGGQRRDSARRTGYDKDRVCKGLEQCEDLQTEHADRVRFFLEYCDLDSIARLFKQPVIWNEVTQQYVADSVYALVREAGWRR